MDPEGILYGSIIKERNTKTNSNIGKKEEKNKYISLEYISPAKILLRSNSSPENKVITIKSNVKSMIIS
jgi:hypothetical protein|tara:strand:+ start:5540 stop:5746 length:207 start_codon:yes stop_codon:yes gene_type:complete